MRAAPAPRLIHAQADEAAASHDPAPAALGGFPMNLTRELRHSLTDARIGSGCQHSLQSKKPGTSIYSSSSAAL
jgi:hypothetical protein